MLLSAHPCPLIQCHAQVALSTQYHLNILIHFFSTACIPDRCEMGGLAHPIGLLSQTLVHHLQPKRIPIVSLPLPRCVITPSVQWLYFYKVTPVLMWSARLGSLSVIHSTLMCPHSITGTPGGL